jgi:hypothetical protein
MTDECTQCFAKRGEPCREFPGYNAPCGSDDDIQFGRKRVISEAQRRARILAERVSDCLAPGDQVCLAVPCPGLERAYMFFPVTSRSFFD